MIFLYTTLTALLFQNNVWVKVITKVANRKDFGKFRFNVHATTLKTLALKTRLQRHNILQRYTILRGVLQRTISFPASHVFDKGGTLFLASHKWFTNLNFNYTLNKLRTSGCSRRYQLAARS